MKNAHDPIYRNTLRKRGLDIALRSMERPNKQNMNELIEFALEVAGLLRDLDRLLPASQKFIGPLCAHCKDKHLGIYCPKRLSDKKFIGPLCAHCGGKHLGIYCLESASHKP